MKKKHNFRGKLVFSAILITGFFIFNNEVYAAQQTVGDNIIVSEPDDSFCDDPKNFTDANDIKKCHSAVKSCSNALVNEVKGYQINTSFISNKFYYSISNTTKITNGGNGINVTKDGKAIGSGSALNDRIGIITFSAELKPTITFINSANKEVDIKCKGEFKRYYSYDNTTPPTGSKILNTACKANSGTCWKYVNNKKTNDSELDGTYKFSKMVSLGEVLIEEKGGAKKYSFLEFLYKNFQYCDCSKSAEVDYQMDDKYVKDTIRVLAKSFNASSEAAKSIAKIREYSKTTIKFDSNAIILDDNASVNQSLTCTAFGPQAHDTTGANGGFLLNNSISGTPKYSVIKDSKTGEVIGYNNVRKFAKKGPLQTVQYEDLTDTTVKKDSKGKVIANMKDACTVQCGEQVEVTYGPPVAVKGTVCFEYIITVKSKIQCESKLMEGNIPKPPEVTEQHFDVCDINVQCNNSKGFLQGQAGPNEEFDKCVQEKFNGKYTQKAINYCYKKVYKKSGNVKVNSYYDEIIPEKVATCEWWNTTAYLKKIDAGQALPITVEVWDKKHENKRTTNKPTIDDVVNALYYWGYTGHTSGEYVFQTSAAVTWGDYRHSGTIAAGLKKFSWKKTGGCYWDDYADVYKHDYETVKALVNDDQIFASPRTSGCDCNDENSSCCARNVARRTQIYIAANNNTKSEITVKDETAHRFYKAENGIKVADYISGAAFPGSNSAGAHQDGGWYNNDCGEKCIIYSTKANCVAPGKNTVNPTVDDSKWKKYEETMKKYEEALKQCEAKAKCVEGTTKTTTYTMGANQCTKTDSNGKCTEWKGSQCTTKDNNGTCSDWSTSKICTSSQNVEGKDCKNEWDDGSCVTWKDTKVKDNDEQVTPDNKNYIILTDATGICYGDNNNKYHYINRISFPGTWYDTNKKAVHRNPDCDEKDVLTFRKNAFCVDPDLPNINTKWWIWDQGDEDSGLTPRNQSWKNQKGNIKFDHGVRDTLGEQYDRYAEPDADYNIKGKIMNFGYLNWNIDVSCFYAVNNDGTTLKCDPKKKCCEKPCPEDSKKTIENVDTKSISLDELFPSTDESTKTENVKDVSNSINSDEVVPKKMKTTKTDDTANVVKIADEKEGTGRTPGYNWTCDATDTRIKSQKGNIQDYIVAPVALRKEIEKKGSNVVNQAEELDYSITLTSDNIREIKKYNSKKEKGYYSFDGSIKNDTIKYTVGEKELEIAFYRSNFLRNKSYLTINEQPTDFYCNNFKGGKCYNKNEFFGNSGCDKEAK